MLVTDQKFDNIPDELKKYTNFVLWKYENRGKDVKPTKVPYNPHTLSKAKTNDKTTWGTYSEAFNKFNDNKDDFSGIGFVFEKENGIVGIDIDHCIDEEGNIEDYAIEIVKKLHSYTEISPSGRGLHILVKGVTEKIGGRKGNIEVYNHVRFFTMTGVTISPYKYKLIDNKDGVLDICKRYIKQKKYEDLSCEKKDGDSSINDCIIKNMIIDLSKSEKFTRLFNGNFDGYPSQSEADLALCLLIYKKTKDRDIVDKIFRRSSLYRDKWDEMRGSDTYGNITINKAISFNDSRGSNGNYMETSQLPKVPLDAFPKKISDLLTNASESLYIPIEIPVACFLALLSCLVGRSREVLIKDKWTESGNLWIATVADSGTGKSPCINLFFRYVYLKEYNLKKEYDKEMDDYKFKDEIYNRRLKDMINACVKNKVNINTNTLIKPQKPCYKQIIVDDITQEALGNVLKDNPKGIMWISDEISALMLNLDRYTRTFGGTKARLLSTYDCDKYKTSRASNNGRNFIIKNACVSIFGGIQPKIFNKIFDCEEGGYDEESGFLPRFMFIYAANEYPQYFSDVTFDDKNDNLLKMIINVMSAWDVEHDNQGNELKKVIKFSDRAKATYKKWHNDIAEQAFRYGNSARSSKIKGIALRICLLLHCLDAVINNTDEMADIREETVKRALSLCDWIYKSHKQYFSMFVVNNKTITYTPLEIAIMEVIIEYRDEVLENGKITNAILSNEVKSKPNMDTVSHEEIGRAAKKLGLTPSKSGGERVQKVSKELISVFESVLTVPTVPTVSSDVAAEAADTTVPTAPSAPSIAYMTPTSCVPARANTAYESLHFDWLSEYDGSSIELDLPQEIRDYLKVEVKRTFNFISI